MINLFLVVLMPTSYVASYLPLSQVLLTCWWLSCVVSDNISNDHHAVLHWCYTLRASVKSIFVMSCAQNNTVLNTIGWHASYALVSWFLIGAGGYRWVPKVTNDDRWIPMQMQLGDDRRLSPMNGSSGSCLWSRRGNKRRFAWRQNWKTTRFFIWVLPTMVKLFMLLLEELWKYISENMRNTCGR